MTNYEQKEYKPFFVDRRILDGLDTSGEVITEKNQDTLFAVYKIIAHRDKERGGSEIILLDDSHFNNLSEYTQASWGEKTGLFLSRWSRLNRFINAPLSSWRTRSPYKIHHDVARRFGRAIGYKAKKNGYKYLHEFTEKQLDFFGVGNHATREKINNEIKWGVNDGCGGRWYDKIKVYAPELTNVILIMPQVIDEAKEFCVEELKKSILYY